MLSCSAGILYIHACIHWSIHLLIHTHGMQDKSRWTDCSKFIFHHTISKSISYRHINLPNPNSRILARVNYWLNWPNVQIWCIHITHAMPQNVPGRILGALFMMTSSNGNIFRVTGPLWGELIGYRWISPPQRPVTRNFDVFFDLRLNKRLSKQSWGWWFETPSRPLWRHCNRIN